MIISLFSSRIKLGSGSEKETITTDFLRIYIDSEREKETIITNFLRIELESESEKVTITSSYLVPINPLPLGRLALTLRKL